MLDELWTYDNQITNYSIIVISGDVVRYTNSDGKTAFLINETPHLVVSDVEKKKIGDPIPLIRAFDQQMYEDSQIKYSKDFFQIPYIEEFKKVAFECKVPLTNKGESSNLTAKIYRNNTKRLANNHILLGDDKISAKILCYAFKYHKAKLVLKRLSKTTFVCSNTLMKTHSGLFSKKLCKIPIFTNNTLVFRGEE